MSKDENKDPLVKEDEPGEVPKSKIITYYALTVGAMLLIVIIVLIIAVQFGGTSTISDIEKSNSLKSKYISKENPKIKLFNTNLIKSISSMKIDGNNANITDEYTFESKGEYTIEVILKEDLNSFDRLFENCSDLIGVDLSQIRTSKLTNMSKMFYDCVKLTSVDLSKLNTSKVVDMSDLFNGCIELEFVNFNKISTINVERMNNMFYASIKLKSLNLKNFNTSKVEDMSCMFMRCSFFKRTKSV